MLPGVHFKKSGQRERRRTTLSLGEYRVRLELGQHGDIRGNPVETTPCISSTTMRRRTHARASTKPGAPSRTTQQICRSPMSAARPPCALHNKSKRCVAFSMLTEGVFFSYEIYHSVVDWRLSGARGEYVRRAQCVVKFRISSCTAVRNALCKYTST